MVERRPRDRKVTGSQQGRWVAGTAGAAGDFFIFIIFLQGQLSVLTVGIRSTPLLPQ